ncbi:E3 ubiquitin-protein ligase RNF14-like [Halichoeres trimaculatus]|uniref:E3 ubiquitin-protein ligase RNF14-like n=1 Tax=Halichoeres trimaculatus TaxID=147232 RepID=UPI003D9E0188
MNANREEQEDELLALQSIFDSDQFVRDESKFTGEIRVSVELPADFTVVLKEGKTQKKYDISFLPPLLLTFELPEDYPSSSPPSFTLTCSWLTHTQLSALTAQLTDLYQANGGAVVLFIWIQFLKEDALGFLDIHSLLELPSDAESDSPTPSKGAENITGILGNGQDPEPSSGTSEDSEEAKEFIPHELNPEEGILIQDADKISQASDEGESDQEHETSESKVVSERNQEDILNGGDLPASSLPSSSSEHPPDDSGQSGSASLPAHPEMSSQNEQKTTFGLSLTPSQALMSKILIYNAEQKQKEFATTVFDCGVCYMGWLGSECIELLGCGHIFCRGCLGEFCKVQITEGNVRGVTCPNTGCPATPTPAQVKSLVGEELYSRYDRLLLQMTLDSMPDVIYCPRRTCAAACISEKSSRAAMCFVCNFAFCIACKKTYHGTDDCQNKKEIKEEKEDPRGTNMPLPRSAEGIKALWEDYSTGSKERKKLLESRYGRGRLRFTVQEGLSENWMEINSKFCPHCFSRIQKDGGCNRMFCTQCRRPFCWGCEAKVSLHDTNSHSSESPCCMHTY